MKEWHQKQVSKYQHICDQGHKNFSAGSNNSVNNQPTVSNDSEDAFEKEMNEALNIAQKGLAYVCQYLKKTPPKINIPKEASTDNMQNSVLDSPNGNAGLDESITSPIAIEAPEPVSNDSFDSQRLSNHEGSDNCTPIKDDTKDSLNSSDSLIESSLKKKGKKSPRLNNSFLNKLLKPTKKSDKEKEPERKKNLSANSDNNEGDLIDTIELDEPDHAPDNHPDDRVELLRTRARRQAREKQNAVNLR